jgi:hypothetical protein
MATEPERPIEKLLRACAKKRSDEVGAPFDLHPATRRLLQGEVARKLARRAPKSDLELGFFARMWPRLAWGAAIFAVLAVVVWIIAPGSSRESRRFDLAKNEAQSEATLAERLPKPSAAVPAPLPVQPAPTTRETHAVDLDAASGGKDKAVEEAALTKLQRANGPMPAKTDYAMEEKRTLAAASDATGNGKNREVNRISPPSQPAANSITPEPAEAFRRRYGLAPAVPAPAASPAEAPAAPAMPPATTLADSAAAGRATATDQNLRKSKEEAPTPGRQPVPASAAYAPSLGGEALKLRKDSLKEAVEVSGERGEAQGFTQVQRFARAQVQADSAVDGRQLRAATSEAEAAPSQLVLMSFRVEQRDREMQIIDADGSVYSGFAQPDAQSDRRGIAASTRALKAPTDQSASSPLSLKQAQASAAQGYSFRVAGTNRTLGQKVIFTGKLSALTNLTSLRMQMITNSLSGASALSSDRLGSLLPLHSRITGRLSIGGGKEVEIQAVPVSP